MVNKKAQAWGLDLMIALTIFFIGIITFFIYTLNYSTNSQEKMDSLKYDGEFIAQSLLNTGFPENWNSTNVNSIGLTTENIINETKLENFYYLSRDNYNKTRAIFNTRYNYFIYFSEDIEISGNSIGGLGEKPLNPKNLMKTTRLTIYKNKPSTIYVEIWE